MGTTTQHGYGFGAKVALSFEQALEQVTALLKEEGFGVLTEIDVQKTLKEKLGAEFRRYRILGACNPQLAHRAFGAELEIGLLLPCNVAVYEDGDRTQVSIMDPGAALGFVGNPALGPVADEARARLQRVAGRLAAL
jgi:uncharacterized protein (DUF302 family)